MELYDTRQKQLLDEVIIRQERLDASVQSALKRAYPASIAALEREVDFYKKIGHRVGLG